jgi:integrase
MSPGSLAEYESKVRLHLLPAFGKLKPADLKAAAIKEWRNKKLVESENISNKRVLGVEGIKGVLRVLSAFYGYLTDQEVVVVNPARGLGQFSTRHRERYLTNEEIFRLYAALDAHRTQWPHWVSIIELALLTGMRKSEILALNWDNVEFSERRIILKKHKTHLSTGVKYVPLNEQALEVLQVANAWRREGNPFVFPSVADQSFYVKNDEASRDRVMTHATAGGLQRAWEIIREEASLDGHEGEKFVFHGIRHSVASMAISNGVNIAVVGNMLGQKSTSTTSRYAKVAISAAAGAAQVVGTIVSAQAARSRKPG